MKKNNKLIIIITSIILVVIVLVTILLLNYNQKINNFKGLWPIYDNNIASIKNTMDEITSPNETFYWWELKELNIVDKTYQQALNNVVSDIRVCYMGFTEEGENYSNSNPVLEYRKNSKITKKDLKTLNWLINSQGTCTDRFDKYNQLLISEDEGLRNNFLYEINKVASLRNEELFKNEEATYDELVLRKYVEVSAINRLSAWIASEYNRLNKKKYLD